MADDGGFPPADSASEYVALILTMKILAYEEKAKGSTVTSPIQCPRKELLDTYAECMQAVRGLRSVPRPG
jgi:hypothetical protein